MDACAGLSHKCPNVITANVLSKKLAVFDDGR